MNESGLESMRRQVLADMQAWLERAVIGLNLCPFAKGVVSKHQLHWALSLATEPDDLRLALIDELQGLRDSDPNVRETTLLVAPLCLTDFLDFNDFLDVADAAVYELGLEGEFQLANFHPDYLFAGTSDDDITNFTNRAPYPTLHLLRESSIDRAVASFPEAEMIYERNMATMRELGVAGWKALRVGPHVSISALLAAVQGSRLQRGNP